MKQLIPSPPLQVRRGEDTSKPLPPPITSTEAPKMVSSVKHHILKKVQMTKDKGGNEVEVPPVTAQQILARTRERKAKSTLLMAILDEHLDRFHRIKDAKTLWAAIKTRFEGLDKGYDRFQKLLSLLEIHRACVSTEDANQKFLRSLPSAWSKISLIMRNKPNIDNLDIDDLYNNLKVYEADIKGSSRSSSNSQNVAFVSAESTNITNELNVAYSVSTATGHRKNQLVLTKPRLSVLTVIEEDTLPGITDQPETQGIGVEMLGMQGTEEEIMSSQVEEKATDFALMAFTSNPSSSSSLNSERKKLRKANLEIVANDRFKKGEQYHAVPPPLTGNYMPPKSDLSFAGLDDSVYKFKINETVTSLTTDEKDSPETSTACVEKPKEEKSSAPLIQD
uniref:Ribonuclease H-like domain-containing protein n=1 Tax=Tanacetum cinerariifolium TaxID=118510 RepID=A0A6L2KA60_TANCI|nr:ribonuclease H-like domain-containing protein [Tanacetum cinerariifolium]